MAVTTSTCFLCHFKDEPFNEGLGACTRCHQIPDKKFDLGGGVMFTHDLAYEKGVDCANCHGDVIRGKGEVPRERCLVCHNREDDLKRIDDHEFMHQNHVTEHKIDCLAMPPANRALAGPPQDRARRLRLPVLPSRPPPRAGEHAPRHRRKTIPAQASGMLTVRARVPHLPSEEGGFPHGDRALEGLGRGVYDVPRPLHRRQARIVSARR